MILIPIGDVNEHGEAHASFVNYGMILTCVAVFGYQMYLASLGGDQLDAFMRLWTFDPKRELGEAFLSMSTGERIGALIKELCDLSKGTFVKMAAAAFLHGSIIHLLSNMFALWMLGDNVEYVMGHMRYLMFFILTAVIATCGQLVFATAANFNGIIGASGGIFAVAAAYLVYFPRAKINFFYWVFIVFWGVRPISARLMIGLYFLSQLGTSFSDIGSDYGRVAVWAHVWGFLSGLILCFWFRKGRDEKHADYIPIPATPPRRQSPWTHVSGGSWGKPSDPAVSSPWGSRPGEKKSTDSKFSKKPGPWG